MKYLKKGLQHTFSSISRHKGLFLILILLQAAFFISTLFISVSYEIKILQDAQGIIEPLQTANYDPQSIEEGNLFTQDLASIYNSYNSMISNIKSCAYVLLSLFMVLNGGLWILTFFLLKKKIIGKSEGRLKQALHMWIKFIVSVVVIMGPFFVITYYLLIYLLRSESFTGSFPQAVNYLLYVIIAFYYFLISALAMINSSSWKSFIKNFWLCSVKKIHLSMLVLAINAVLLSAGCLAIYGAVAYEKSLLLITAASLLFLIIVVITRIFWIASLNGLVNEYSKGECSKG